MRFNTAINAKIPVMQIESHMTMSQYLMIKDCVSSEEICASSAEICACSEEICALSAQICACSEEICCSDAGKW